MLTLCIIELISSPLKFSIQWREITLLQLAFIYTCLNVLHSEIKNQQLAQNCKL